MILAFVFWFEFLHNDAMFDLFRHIIIGGFITALGLATLIYVGVKKKKSNL
ncbi:MAG TPA: hypothetical protein VMZ29_10815 [Candidatus Bathyarchaeia archaeon]|nr:hypothetical protein [Candidatus Bathyarchaeia archaeon]